MKKRAITLTIQSIKFHVLKINYKKTTVGETIFSGDMIRQIVKYLRRISSLLKVLNVTQDEIKAK
jgi:hypothetical protein